MISSLTYEEMKDEEIKVTLMPQGPNEREPNEILTIALSNNEKWLAIITGKKLIKD